jgi:hypothetical protein
MRWFSSIEFDNIHAAQSARTRSVHRSSLMRESASRMKIHCAGNALSMNERGALQVALISAPQIKKSAHERAN